MKDVFQIILFYKYVEITSPEDFRDSQRLLCQKLGLKGRIIVANEGMNATVEGKSEAVGSYISELQKDPRFADLHIKRSEGSGNAFPRLSVKVRPEIVSLKLGEADLNPNEVTGKHIPAEELYAWIRDEKKDFVIVDMRNDYEHKVGHFKDSILLPMSDFRDLPKVMDKLEPLKNKTIVTVCTGGVRCEKASGFLVKSGFKDVYQLDGGIHTYMEKFKNDDFQGQLYVFDDRVVMTYTPDNERTIVGRCYKCNAPSEHYVNCENDACHMHFVCCESCIKKDGVYCRITCKMSPTRLIIDTRRKIRRSIKMFANKTKRNYYKWKVKMEHSV